MKTAEKFWESVNKNGPIPAHCPELGNCWEWTKGLRPRGYGHVWWKGQDHGAHRVSWLLTYGSWPNPYALHKCDNRRCVRPTHLFEGNNADNTADMMRKGRFVDRRGEKNTRAKLTNTDVSNIRARLVQGAEGQQVAREFKVSSATVSQIKTGRYWSHVLQISEETCDRQP